MFSCIAASVADVAADNPNSNIILLANEVSTLSLFINGKRAAINELRKLRNHPSLLVIFVVVPFNKIPLFPKDLITFIIPYTFRVILEPLLKVIFFKSLFIPLLTICLVASQFIFGVLFINSFVPFLRSSYGKPKSNSPRIPPDCIILENWVFEIFILAGKPFANALRIFETCNVEN